MSIGSVKEAVSGGRQQSSGKALWKGKSLTWEMKEEVKFKKHQNLSSLLLLLYFLKVLLVSTIKVI